MHSEYKNLTVPSLMPVSVYIIYSWPYTHVKTFKIPYLFNLTKIPVTNDTSNMVGTILNTKALRTEFIPLKKKKKKNWHKNI
jgi:hypothetical protein